MLLQRRLVVMLNNYYIKNGSGITREDFVEYVSNKIWPRLNYFWPRKERFKNRVDQTFGDCVRGNFAYASEDDDGKKLLVTTRGREFISILSLGFFEEFRKRRKRTTDVIYERVIGGFFAVIGSGLLFVFVKYIWPLLAP